MSGESGRLSHLLVVDDDDRIRVMLSRYLADEGFDVSLAGTAAELRRQLQGPRIDLVLLDLVLPDGDGFSLVKEIRARSDAGIIMITGRADEVDRIVGLEVGADDYIAKPFSLREVLARIRSVLRRLQPASRETTVETAASGSTKRFQGWTFDAERRRLTAPDGAEVPLTTGEFDILHVFVQHPGRVLSRDFLMDHTRGRSWEVFDRSIDAQISRLRRKLEANPKEPKLLKSVRGVGYVLAERVEPAGG
ncbi:response regulator [Mangrovicella endophytica]|uniref:response regulator n=1 Tax=Mangrovicella endophytica TaxID=2066697 RepID=UPI000C9E547E|nr:response regulator [Mangrovicella endophytica]